MRFIVLPLVARDGIKDVEIDHQILRFPCGEIPQFLDRHREFYYRIYLAVCSGFEFDIVDDIGGCLIGCAEQQYERT